MSELIPTIPLTVKNITLQNSLDLLKNRISTFIPSSTKQVRRFMKINPFDFKKNEEVKTRLARKLSRMTFFIHNNDKNEIDIDEFRINDDNHLQLIFNIFSKKEGRNITENQLLLNYLHTMIGFVDMIKKALNDDVNLLTELLTTISFYLGYEKYEKNIHKFIQSMV